MTIRGSGRMVAGTGGRSTPQALAVQGRRFSGHLSALGGITDRFNRPDSIPGTPGGLGESDSGHQWTNDFGDPPGDEQPESVIEGARLHVIRAGNGNQTTHLGGSLNVYDTRAQGPGLLPGSSWDCTFEWELDSLNSQMWQFWNGPATGAPGAETSIGWIEFYPSAGSYMDGPRSYGGPNKLQLIMISAAGTNYSWTEFDHTFVADVVYKLRWFFDGTAVRAKIWLASAEEPAAWTFEHTGTAVGFEQKERAFVISTLPTGGTGGIYIENLDITGVGSGSGGPALKGHGRVAG